MIQSAIDALATVALGRRTVVWGGHPAITPMLWESAKNLGVLYGTAVQLFQSKFFREEDFPAQNKHFRNVTYVDAVDQDREKSLLAMRTAMLNSQPFDAAVFLGGMEGVFDEFRLFNALYPNAKCLPVAVTGGATRTLSAQMRYVPPADIGPLDFVRLFYRELAISPRQRRTP
jgi:hypothetical protein